MSTLSADCRLDVDGELVKLDSDGYRPSRTGPGLLPRTTTDVSTDPVGSEAGQRVLASFPASWGAHRVAELLEALVT